MNHFVGELLPDGLETWALSWQATSDYNISLIKNAGNQVFRYGTEEFYIAGNNLIEGKTRFWTQLRQGITGYLQWAADNYRTYVTNVESPYYLCDENGKLIMRDFWKDPYVFIPIEDYPTYSAGGDSYLFYPGFENDGIVNRNMLVKTIRLFGVRDGIEDYSIPVSYTHLFGNRVEVWQMYTVLIFAVVVVLAAYIIINCFDKKKKI